MFKDAFFSRKTKRFQTNIIFKILHLYILLRLIFLALWQLAVFSVLKSAWATAVHCQESRQLLFVASGQTDMSRAAKPTNATEEKNTLS